MNKSIVLCGFMGSGKSTLGKELAALLQYDFIDMDTYIEQNEGLSVSQIFAQKGEEYFRAAEAKACEVFSLQENTVIAAGGGALTFPKNASILKERCRVVWLDTPLEVIEQRLASDNSRPLFDMHTARALYEERKPLYEQASHIRANGAVTAAEIYSLLIGENQ